MRKLSGFESPYPYVDQTFPEQRYDILYLFRGDVSPVPGGEGVDAATQILVMQVIEPAFHPSGLWVTFRAAPGQSPRGRRIPDNAGEVWFEESPDASV